MSKADLPGRASLEYLKKLAKERLRELRATEPAARLADAQLAVAREHGFPSWRALKAEVDRRSASPADALFTACAAGDVDAVRDLLDGEPSLVRARDDNGATPLHAALPHPDVVRLLLEYGADPNAREPGDNALPLHLAAGSAPLETVRALLDAGSDVHGHGDAHALDVIGWAACFAEPRRDVIDLLVARGARHHVFSAIALNDPDLLRRVVADEPDALQRRLSPDEQEQTALHYVIAPPDGLVGGLFRTGEHYRTLDTLIELGADLDATDAKGRTALDTAMLRGDREAMRRLHDAGARTSPAAMPHHAEPAGELARSVTAIAPMVAVPDVDTTVAWYRAIGFRLTRSNSDDRGRMDWAEVTLGSATIMFVPSGDPWRSPTSNLSLWLRTSRIDDLYAHFRSCQLRHARAVLAGTPPDTPELRFTADLNTMFYGQREFGFSDPNGIELMFHQPL